MTDPTNPGDIFVVGQRRSSGGQFPGNGGSGGGDGDIGGPVSNQDEEPAPYEPLPTPCADPATALEWNADAAAAKALAKMLAAAAAQNDVTHNLSNREYGGMICEYSDGTLSISDIEYGDPIFDEHGTWLNPGVQPSVDVSIGACSSSGGKPLGMFHSHPGVGSSAGLPSVSDATWVNAINNIRGDVLGRIYIVSIGSGSPPYQIHVYNHTNVQAGTVQGVIGPEVNPDGEPCSEISIR